MVRQTTMRMGDWLTEYERRYQAAETGEAEHREGAIERLWELTHLDQEHRLARKRLHQPLTEIEKRHYYVEEVRRWRLFSETGYGWWRDTDGGLHRRVDTRGREIGDPNVEQGMTYDQVRQDAYFKHWRRLLAKWEDRNARGQVRPKDRRPDGEYAKALEALHYRQPRSLDNVGETPKVKSR